RSRCFSLSRHSLHHCLSSPERLARHLPWSGHYQRRRHLGTPTRHRDFDFRPFFRADHPTGGGSSALQLWPLDSFRLQCPPAFWCGCDPFTAALGFHLLSPRSFTGKNVRILPAQLPSRSTNGQSHSLLDYALDSMPRLSFDSAFSSTVTQFC